MTFEELIGEAQIAADEGALFEMDGKDALDLLETLLAQDQQIDDTWRALEIDPLDAPSAMQLAGEAHKARARARKQGADALLIEALEIIEQAAIPAGEKARIRVELQNTAKGLK